MNLFLFAALILFLLMSGLFLLALQLKDNSIVDVAYGAAFVLLGWCSWIFYGAAEPRSILLVALVSLWGIRLAWHISLRKKREQGEDFRYRQWRETWGKTFIWRSYLQVFMLQGAVIYLVALPLLLVIHSAGPPLGWLDLAGVLVWLTGFLFEAVGDWQLLRFKKNPLDSGHIMQQGLWKLTRHPNYFGEALLWWGVFLIAINAPWGMLAIISPLLIDFLLLKVSGIPMLEAKYEGRPDYAAYRKRTNAFFPWFPREGGSS